MLFATCDHETVSPLGRFLLELLLDELIGAQTPRAALAQYGPRQCGAWNGNEGWPPGLPPHRDLTSETARRDEELNEAKVL